MVDAPVTAPPVADTQQSVQDVLDRAQRLLAAGTISQDQFDKIKAAASTVPAPGSAPMTGVKTPDYGNSSNNMQKFGAAVSGVGQKFVGGLQQGFNQQPTSPGPTAGGTYDAAGTPSPGWDQ